MNVLHRQVVNLLDVYTPIRRSNSFRRRDERKKVCGLHGSIETSFSNLSSLCLLPILSPWEKKKKEMRDTTDKNS